MLQLPESFFVHSGTVQLLGGFFVVTRRLPSARQSRRAGEDRQKPSKRVSSAGGFVVGLGECAELRGLLECPEMPK
jgi:hypothetical protein